MSYSSPDEASLTEGSSVTGFNPLTHKQGEGYSVEELQWVNGSLKMVRLRISPRDPFLMKAQTRLQAQKEADEDRSRAVEGRLKGTGLYIPIFARPLEGRIIIPLDETGQGFVHVCPCAVRDLLREYEDDHSITVKDVHKMAEKRHLIFSDLMDMAQELGMRVVPGLSRELH